MTINKMMLKTWHAIRKLREIGAVMGRPRADPRTSHWERALTTVWFRLSATQSFTMAVMTGRTPRRGMRGRWWLSRNGPQLKRVFSTEAETCESKRVLRTS